jgi:hypothetical protein
MKHIFETHETYRARCHGVTEKFRPALSCHADVGPHFAHKQASALASPATGKALKPVGQSNNEVACSMQQG